MSNNCLLGDAFPKPVESMNKQSCGPHRKAVVPSPKFPEKMSVRVGSEYSKVAGGVCLPKSGGNGFPSDPEANGCLSQPPTPWRRSVGPGLHLASQG